MKPRMSVLLLAAFAVLAMAGPMRAVAGDGVPVPVLSTGMGTRCVAPVDDMRRNHMTYLLHQRDETVRQGIRGKKFSLRKCVICHATPDSKAEGVPTVRPFCEECHAYAAVQIDCFSCHTAKPEKIVTGGLSPGLSPDLSPGPASDREQLSMMLRNHLQRSAASP